MSCPKSPLRISLGAARPGQGPSSQRPARSAGRQRAETPFCRPWTHPLSLQPHASPTTQATHTMPCPISPMQGPQPHAHKHGPQVMQRATDPPLASHKDRPLAQLLTCDCNPHKTHHTTLCRPCIGTCCKGPKPLNPRSGKFAQPVISGQ